MKTLSQLFKNSLKRLRLNYNLESRIERQLEKDNATARRAPNYASDKKVPPHPHSHALHKFKPELKERVDKFKIHVQEVEDGVIPEERKGDKTKSHRPLPQRGPLLSTGDFFNPTVVPAGKLTINQVTQLLMSHKKDPHRKVQLADEFNLEVQQVHDIVSNFAFFRLRNDKEYEEYLEGIESKEDPALYLQSESKIVRLLPEPGVSKAPVISSDKSQRKGD